MKIASGKHIATFEFRAIRMRAISKSLRHELQHEGRSRYKKAAQSLKEFALQSFHSPHAASLWDHSVSHALGSVQIFSRSFRTALPPMPLGSKN